MPNYQVTRKYQLTTPYTAQVAWTSFETLRSLVGEQHVGPHLFCKSVINLCSEPQTFFRCEDRYKSKSIFNLNVYFTIFHDILETFQC